MEKQNNEELTITVVHEDDKTLPVNVLPTNSGDSDNPPLTTPLGYMGTPEELDADLGRERAGLGLSPHIVLPFSPFFVDLSGNLCYPEVSWYYLFRQAWRERLWPQGRVEPLDLHA